MDPAGGGGAEGVQGGEVQVKKNSVAIAIEVAHKN